MYFPPVPHVTPFGLLVLGLPAHPLVVHAAVVLVPLSACAFIGLCWRERWRERYLFPIMILAVGGAVATFLAKATGESLQHTLARRIGDHPEQGNMAFLCSFIYSVACI